MANDQNNFKFLINKLSRGLLLTVSAIVLFLIIAAAAMFYFNKDNRLTISENERIELTPTQIRSMESIGQWEFLSISDEELIDTVRHGFFGDDELVRIYYGTLRLGIDMNDAKEGWIRQENDSVIAILPAIKLLDEHFIDEAHTRSFFESGKWSNDDRGKLYDRAYHAMIKRCINEKNIASAERNACEQFDKLLRSMGFEKICVRISKSETKTKKNAKK